MASGNTGRGRKSVEAQAKELAEARAKADAEARAKVVAKAQIEVPVVDVKVWMEGDTAGLLLVPPKPMKYLRLSEATLQMASTALALPEGKRGPIAVFEALQKLREAHQLSFVVGPNGRIAIKVEPKCEREQCDLGNIDLT